MINRVVLTGRFTKKPELTQTKSGVSVSQFTLAVDRRFSKNNEADYIRCVAWRKTAENIIKYFDKGDLIGVDGSLQTRRYDDKDGKRVFVTEMIVNQFSFLTSKKDRGAVGNSQQSPVSPQQQPQATQTSSSSKSQPTQQPNTNTPAPNTSIPNYSNIDISDDDLPF